MNWADALAHMPQRLVVTDRKGRVLLLSGAVPGVKVGRSFLKMAKPEAVVTLGRAAKRALRSGTPQTVPSLRAVNRSTVSIELVPFGTNNGQITHLLVLVRSLVGRPSAPIARTETKKKRVPVQRPVEPEPRGGAEASDVTPNTMVERKFIPLPRVPPAKELVVIAAGGSLPIARALEAVMADRIQTRAIPVTGFINVLRDRTGGRGNIERLDSLLEPSTRLLFVGECPFSTSIRDKPLRSGPGSAASWAISGVRVRRSAIWLSQLPKQGLGDMLADLQFEIMEVARKAMPVRRAGRRIQVSTELKLAATFLEQPVVMGGGGQLQEQVRHHQMVLGVARFLQDGLSVLLGGLDG